MKISTRKIFNEYAKGLNSDRQELKGEIEDYKASKIYLLSKLEIYKHYIDNFTNINYEEIGGLDKGIGERSLIHLVNIAGTDISQIRRVINMIAEINRSLNKIEKRIKQIEIDLIAYIAFEKIVFKFDNKISDEIVYKGYTLNLGSGLGHIRIKKVNCKFNRNGTVKLKKQIDWEASNKKKIEILERGGVPFKVTERDDKGKILADNGGEKWFCYFNYEWDYMWHWSKGTGIVLNTQYYKFRPTIYNNTSKQNGRLGNINKLKKLVREQSPLLSNFTEKATDFAGNQHVKV